MDSLWKKTSNIAGSSYVNLFENIRSGAVSFNSVMAPALRAMFSYTQKNDASSVNYREQGNQKFQQQKWCEAMSCYNQSLCFAEIGSENVSLAYANRSACFFRLKEYKRCLIDIELAEQAGYPSHLIPKLKERREHCLKSIETDGDTNEQFEPKLSYEPNKVLAGCADVLQIQVNKRLGRYVNASCHIPAGKTVLVEEPFIGRPGDTRYKRCAACLKDMKNFIACSKCTNSIFCDTTCSTKNVHQMECNYNYNDSDKLELHLEFIAHSIFVAMSIFPDIQSLMEFVQDVVKEKSKTLPELLIDMKSKYRAFLQLSVFLSPTTLDECLKLGNDWYNNLMLREIIQKQFDTEEKKSFLMHLTVHHILIASTNAYLPAPADARFLFIAASYFNHSCEPNVFRANYQNRLVFITTRPIQAGEQLFIRYNDLIDAEPVARRQAHFMEKYGFQCKCERCESVVPASLIDMYTKGLIILLLNT